MTSSSSENLMNLDTWMYKSSSTSLAAADSWLSEAFARDSETLTRALHQSLLSTNDNNCDVFAAYDNNTTTSIAMSPFLNAVNPAVSSGSDHDSIPNRRRIAAATANGKIAKRKSRASKRCTTTFIMADPANFRQMVQQVTGVKFGGGNSPAVAGGVLRPETQRAGGRFMPTIDKSAFLMDQYQQQEVSQGTDVSFTAGGDGGGLDFNGLSCFPTLESWNVISTL